MVFLFQMGSAYQANQMFQQAAQNVWYNKLTDGERTFLGRHFGIDDFMKLPPNQWQGYIDKTVGYFKQSSPKDAPAAAALLNSFLEKVRNEAMIGMR